MPDTPDGKSRITLLERNMRNVNRKLDGVVSDVSHIKGDIAEMKKCLLGDPEYKIPGIIGEHKDMYKDYNGARWFLKNVWSILAGIAVAISAIIARLITEK